MTSTTDGKPIMNLLLMLWEKAINNLRKTNERAKYDIFNKKERQLCRALLAVQY